MGYWSPEARASYRKRNREKLNQNAREYKRRNPEKVKESWRKCVAKASDVIYVAKNKPCADCDRRFPLCVMQFDHVRGEKFANLSALRSRGNVRLILAEIVKCDVVCANCHAIRTCKRDLQRSVPLRSRMTLRQCEHVKVGGAEKDALPEPVTINVQPVDE